MMTSPGGVFDQSTVPVVDTYPPFLAQYLNQPPTSGKSAASVAQLYWMSVVFHCGTDNSRFLCGKLQPVAAGDASPPCAFADPSASTSATTSANSAAAAQAPGLVAAVVVLTILLILYVAGTAYFYVTRVLRKGSGMISQADAENTL